MKNASRQGAMKALININNRRATQLGGICARISGLLLCADTLLPSKKYGFSKDFWQRVYQENGLSQETVEERIHQLQIEKAKLADGILAGADVIRKLDASMVRELLG
ncbi:MAG: hypothetical protein AB8D78_05500 [Akkermansiaceae bacterium]